MPCGNIVHRYYDEIQEDHTAYEGKLMDRRLFLAGLGGALAWPAVSLAQQSKMYRVGALIIGNADAESFRTELREELRRHGYIEGQNIQFELRSAEEKLDRL